LLPVFAKYSVFHKKKKHQKVGLLGKATGASHEEKSERKNKLQDLVQRIDMSYCSKWEKTK